MLCLRQRKFGYMLGAASGVFWLWTAGTLWGYCRGRNKSWRDVGLFAATSAMVAVFFVSIFAAFAPRYLSMFRRLFGG